MTWVMRRLLQLPGSSFAIWRGILGWKNTREWASFLTISHEISCRMPSIHFSINNCRGSAMILAICKSAFSSWIIVILERGLFHRAFFKLGLVFTQGGVGRVAWLINIKYMKVCQIGSCFPLVVSSQQDDFQQWTRFFGTRGGLEFGGLKLQLGQIQQSSIDRQAFRDAIFNPTDLRLIPD